MAKENKLSVEIRESTGKSAAKKVLAAGRIPSVIYGLKEEPLTISVDRMTVQKELKAGGFLTKIFSLDINGKASLAIPRDVQFHPWLPHTTYRWMASRSPLHCRSLPEMGSRCS